MPHSGDKLGPYLARFAVAQHEVTHVRPQFGVARRPQGPDHRHRQRPVDRLGLCQGVPLFGCGPRGDLSQREGQAACRAVGARARGRDPGPARPARGRPAGGAVRGDRATLGPARLPPAFDRLRAARGPARTRGRLLQGRLPAGHGHLLLVVHPHGQAGRALDDPGRGAVLHDLSRLADRHRALQHDGTGQGRTGERHALSRGRARSARDPGARDLAGPAQDARGVRHRRLRRDARPGAGQGADAAAGVDRGCRVWPPPISPRTRPS